MGAGIISSCGNIDSGGQGGDASTLLRVKCNMTGISPSSTTTINGKIYNTFPVSTNYVKFYTVTALDDEEEITISELPNYICYPIANNNNDIGCNLTINNGSITGSILSTGTTLSNIQFIFTYVIDLSQTSGTVIQNYTDMLISGDAGIEEGLFNLTTATSNEYSLNVNTGVLDGNVPCTQLYDVTNRRFITSSEYSDLLRNGNFVCTTGVVEEYNLGISSINVKGRNLIDSLAWTYYIRGNKIGVKPTDVRNICQFVYFRYRNDNNSKYEYNQFATNVNQYIYAHSMTVALDASHNVTFTVYTKSYLLGNYSGSDSFYYGAFGYFLYGDSFVEIGGLRLINGNIYLTGSVQSPTGTQEAIDKQVTINERNRHCYLPL